MTRRMRAAPVLALVLLLPLGLAQDARDYAEEVRSGADVHLFLQYSGSATGDRQGSRGYDSMQERITRSISWEGPVTLSTIGGEMTGSLVGEWTGHASYGARHEHHVEGDPVEGTTDFTARTDTACEGSVFDQPLYLEVRAEPTDEGLRVTLEGNGVVQMTVEGACRWTKTQTDEGTTSGTQALHANLAVVHALKESSHDAAVTFTVPYDERTTRRFTYRSAIPHDPDAPAGTYCGLMDTRDWARGACDAEGTLTVRSVVFPCEHIQEKYPGLLADLEDVTPPAAGADEAAVGAWVEANAPKSRAVLSAHRAWQLFGCPGDLQPDPWEALSRVARMQRDALRALHEKGALSPAGVGELVAVERSIQANGGDAGAAPSTAASSAPAPSGTLEVRVHSPVALHAWSEDGGHVGWDAGSDAPVSTIPGATYEGAPGGAQTLRLPAGFYKITVDELASGSYLLEVAMNGTGAEADEAHVAPAEPGRTTSTHYAVTVGWGGARLDAFPVRRGPTPDEVAFFDEGRPSGGTSGTGGTPRNDGPTDAGDGARDAPGLGVALVLAAGAIVALARRR